jgi:hypothetical protein
MLAYVNVQGHTAGFLGFQLALVMVAILNTWYALVTRDTNNVLGGIRGTRVTHFYFTGAFRIWLTMPFISVLVNLSRNWSWLSRMGEATRVWGQECRSNH